VELAHYEHVVERLRLKCGKGMKKSGVVDFREKRRLLVNINIYEKFTPEVEIRGVLS
jgi:hypothetical protein